MRDPNYRAWSNEEKRYTYATDYLLMSNSHKYEYLELFFKHADISVLEETTGLKPKNGTEIFEGDIIQSEATFYDVHRTFKTVVKWDNDIENDSFGEPLTVGYCIIGHSLEVIGNINETPELLK